MKKILLSIAMMLCCIGFASAAELTFSMEQVTLQQTGSDDYGNPSISGFSYDIVNAALSKGSGSSEPSYNNSSKDVRLYGNGTMTLTTTDGSNYQKVVFTIPSSGNGHSRLGNITASTGNVAIDTNAWTVTWTGDAAEVVLTVSDRADMGTEPTKAGRFVISNMTVSTSAGNSSAMPVISPESTTFGDEGIAVTISAANGAKIYYTLDGNNPTESSDLYTAPIALTATTTVKAIAVETGKSASSVATATYTYRSGSFAMTDVLGTAVEGSEYTVGAVVTGICTRGMVVTDNSGSLFIYNASFNHSEYAIGDEVTFTGTVGYYGAGLQFAGADLTIEKWGNRAVTYPQPMDYDWDTAVTRTVAEKAYYVEMEGTLSISGNYYNVVLEGAQTAQGSIYYATDEIKSKMQNGQTVKLKGYFVSISSGKYANILVTEVVAEGDVTAPTQVANIAEFIEKGLTDESTTFEITGEVAVTYQNGSNLYIADATGQILVYGSLSNTYNNGDRLIGVQGSFKNYYSTYEMIPVTTSFGTATAGAPVDPTVYTIENIVPEIQNHYVRTDFVSIDTENSKFIDAIDAEIKYYNKFGVEIPADGAYGVIGVVNYYQAKGAEAPEVQIYPISFIGMEQEEPVAETLAEALQMGAEGETDAIRFVGEVTVVYKNNRNIYIKDDTAWSLLYNKNDVEMPAYKNGDRISAFTITYALNDEHPQFIPVADFSEPTAGQAVDPVAITTSGVSDENYHKYVALQATLAATDDKNATATDSEGTAALYAQWNNSYSDPVVALPADGEYEIRGFVSSYKGAYQLLVSQCLDPGAVEGIEMESRIFIAGNNIIAPENAEIFNINGIRVNGCNLPAGIYIVRHAQTITKVIIR